MTSALNRMIVNAAIEKLVTQTDDDGEAAKIVIAYGSKLKESARVTFEHSSHKKSGGDEVTGHSPDHGNLSIKDKERDTHTERTFGFTKERIGHYRLWRDSKNTLTFHHFWKSSASTEPNQDNRPDEYVLGYNEKTLALGYLGIKRKRILRSFSFGIHFEWHETYLEPVYGTMPKAKGWGFKISNRKH